MTYEELEKALADERLKVKSLEVKMQNLEGRLVFEKNKYEYQVAELSADLSEKITDSLEIELLGIGDITARLDEKNKDRIDRFIRRIRRKLLDFKE